MNKRIYSYDTERDTNFPFNECFYIIQDSKPCDILCLCKKNIFSISNTRQTNYQNETWVVTEKQHCCINLFCCQYRKMELYVIKNYNTIKFVAERSSIIVPCTQCITMKIKKYPDQSEIGADQLEIGSDQSEIGADQLEIGEIQAVSQEFVEQCLDQAIFSKPLVRIIQNGKKQDDQQIFVITINKQSLINYNLRQCCLPHFTIEYQIYQFGEQHSKQIGQIKNCFQGCYKECCTRGDVLEINFFEKLKPETRVLLMFGCLQLNYQKKEQMINLF